MEVRKDTVSAKIHISSIRNEADNLEQRNPTDERIDAMRGFCNFHETLMKVKSKEGSYFNLDSKELLSLEALAQSELAVSYNAKAILNFINEEIPLYQGYDAFFPKSMTLEESETLISSENYFDFKAYPNPSNGNVTFTIDEKMEGNKTIVITDLLGKVIRILPVNNPTINYEFINVPQGTYLAHLVMDGQIEKTIKVMYVE
jgi:hypothetical protein